MKQIILIMLFISISSCATRNIKYSRDKILNKYGNDYQVFLDNEIIDFNTIYLNKDNIKNINLDKRNKQMNISQHKKTNFLKIKDLDTVFNKKIKLGLLVINGVSIAEDIKENIKIDMNIIKSIDILKEENKAMFCRKLDGEFVLIRIK